jgi:pyruvate/2-oxoglutarate dehydrogenase complex dihydrolipoamide dehydrogenase (E3) component
MLEMREYDAVVIGAGQGGGPLSSALARAGHKTAIIEREYVGGTCINFGCTPTKTMVASARVAYLARRAADYGVHAGSVSIDMQAVRKRKRDMVDSFRAGSERHIKETEGLDLLMGEATFVDAHTIDVNMNSGGTMRIRAERFFINAGARPAVPPVPGMEEVSALNSTTVMELDEVPGHLLVLGGGYVGLEFAQMYRRFGSEVTIVHRGEHLLSKEDPDVAEAVTHILEEDGIRILLNSETTRAARRDGGGITFTVRSLDNGEEQTIEGTHLLAAAGRTPNTDKLNPSAAGIELDKRGYIKVNDKLETNVPGIYAMGDVNGGPAFTHISYDDFRILRTNLIEGGSAFTTDRLVPYTVFTDPQLGRVGLSENEARKQGRRIRVASMPMDWISRAVEVDEARGLIKAVVDADTDLILGCAVLGIEGGEIMAQLQIAILGRVPYTVLKEAVFAHPTLAEGLNNLFGSFKDEG